ncbi:hypothetical protein AUC71_08050 [Methyloceanibacter marginalis]|uniref:DUF2948 domain-containing protein n=1 Tax=Methyloceanibacter marginalis TaxID=1774971 RepID=A0A1E3WFB0_9HYPH|nr:DUF2948 family protein [Methyloceanibacter marginalis]ODS03717.1 hypothetical protein AUC71_08050 [Methyloceanibacter marginalis]
MTPLKLLALDEEDLQVVSSHLQDAVVRVGDMAYVPRRSALPPFSTASTGRAPRRTAALYQRRRTALRFDRVLRAQHRDLRPEKPDRVLSLLAIQFEAGDAPSGKVTLLFSGEVTIQLDVECIETELRDLGPAWATRNKPEHPGEDAVESEGSEASGA